MDRLRSEQIPPGHYKGLWKCAKGLAGGEANYFTKIIYQSSDRIVNKNQLDVSERSGGLKTMNASEIERFAREHLAAPRKKIKTQGKHGSKKPILSPSYCHSPRIF